MPAIIFLVLAGLTALGFLIVVWRRRQTPVILRAILILAATAIVVYVGCTIAALLQGGSPPLRP